MTQIIVVPTLNGDVDQRFGKAEQFTVFTIENGSISSETLVSSSGIGEAAKTEDLQTLRPDTVICGGIGMPMAQCIQNLGVDLYGGVTGNARKAVESFIAGRLPQTVHRFWNGTNISLN